MVAQKPHQPTEIASRRGLIGYTSQTSSPKAARAAGPPVFAGNLESLWSRFRSLSKYNQQKKPRSFFRRPGHSSGGVLLSHRVAPAVPSALEGLTTEFGMGSGRALPPSPPENLVVVGWAGALTGSSLSSLAGPLLEPIQCFFEVLSPLTQILEPNTPHHQTCDSCSLWPSRTAH